MPIMNKSQRAAQIWAVLAWAAKNRQVITYPILGKLIGVPTQGLGHLLEPIQSYCLLKRLPPLTILVVQERSGLPGVGFNAASAEEYAKEQMKVFEYDWLGHGGCPRVAASIFVAVPHRNGIDGSIGDAASG